MCYWSRIEKLSLTERMRREVSHRVKEEGNILHKTKCRKANQIGHALRSNCLIKQTVERKIDGGTAVTGRRREWCKQLPYIESGNTRSHVKV